MPRVATLLSWTVLLLITPSMSSAQIGGGGSIQGTVLDTSNAAVPGATVSATNVATGIQTVRQTTEAGVYALTPLQPGEYRVTVSLDGFQTFARAGIIVDALSVFGLNVTLQVGGITQEVLVTAEAPPLATADARLGQTIRNEVYTALPLVMNTGGPRDPTEFMFLMPGVQGIGRWGNVMGGQDFTTDMYVEGIPITNAVVQGEGRNLSFGISVEAIDQFQVETSGTAVTFNGQGASNYVIKSGTNTFRGAGFEYFRNKALDAKAYFARAKPDDNQHEYGGTFGGPIRKNQMFFFVAYDGYRDRRQSASTLQSIPPLAQRNGDFSALPVVIYDPRTTRPNPNGAGFIRDPFPGNRIPADRISPISKYFQSFLPEPSNSSLQNNYLGGSLPIGFDNVSVTTKIDLKLHERQQASVLFSHGKRSQATAYRGNTLPLPYAVTRLVEEIPTSAQVKHTYVLGSQWVNQAGIGFSRLAVPIENATIDGQYPIKAGLRGLPPTPAAPPGTGGRGGRGQTPPRYELTNQDREALRTKLDELDPLVRSLKAKRGEDDLLADVEIHAKAGHWMLEFPQDVTVQEDVTFALKMLDRGIDRAKQLQNGQSPWASQKGKVALGFYSPLDGSVQPLLLTVPASYDGSRPARLDVWLHGRSQRLIESNWICYDPSPANAQTGERLFTHAQGSCLAPSPNPATNGVLNVGQFQLEVFARGNNANHWAGEVDVFESMAAVQRRFKIDNSRIVLRGFSLGGAGAWHLALHHPDRWVAAEIGAGTWPRRYLMMEEFPPHQRPTLRIWENMTEWALNAFNLPIAGHDGDSDPQVASIPRPPQDEPTRGQLESSIRIREQLAREGFPSEGEPNDYVAKGTPSIFLISEKTGHGTSPKVRQRLDAFLKEWTDKGLQSPDHIRFLTYTTRYNKSFWVTVDGLRKHYERAEVDARRLSGGRSYQIETVNVSRLVLRETEQASEIQIDGQTLRVKPGRELALERSESAWRTAPSGKWAGLRKTHGLQGPIDDAFLDPFLLVRPTGTPWNRAAHQHALKRLERFDHAYALYYRAHPRIKNDIDVTEADFAKYNVVLFGDPGSNRWIGRLAAKLPVRWSRDTITVGKQHFAAASHLPVLMYPNPLAPSRYVVLNSGLTIAENSYTSDYSMPTLGDVAVLQVQPDSGTATVPFAGFFDEFWRLP